MRTQGITVTIVTTLVLTMRVAHAAGPTETALDLIRRECSACHGAQGSSISPLFPKLAGQHAEYLEAQLKAYRERSRANPHAQAFMWGMAAQLTDRTITAIAAYFSSLSPPHGSPGDPATMAAGQKVYEEGIPAQGVPACQSCHLSRAEGQGPIPRLGGQHSAYLERQLRAFVGNLRDNEIMRQAVTNLTALQMHQIATFLSGLDVGARENVAADHPSPGMTRCAPAAVRLDGNPPLLIGVPQGDEQTDSTPSYECRK
jgi:cytochrome c553